MTKSILVAFIFALWVPFTASAEEKSALSPAEQLLKVTDFQRLIVDSADAGFGMVKQNLASQNLTPEEMQNVKEAFRTYVTNMASDPRLTKKAVTAYEKAFTNDELLQLVEFYSTPLGKKALTATPALMSEIMVFSQKIAMDHVGSFQEAIAKILANKAEGKADKE